MLAKSRQIGRSSSSRLQTTITPAANKGLHELVSELGVHGMASPVRADMRRTPPAAQRVAEWEQRRKEEDRRWAAIMRFDKAVNDELPLCEALVRHTEQALLGTGHPYATDARGLELLRGRGEPADEEAGGSSSLEALNARAAALLQRCSPGTPATPQR